MDPKPNKTDHRRAGETVEYGMGGQYGPDKLGRIVMEQRQAGQDGYLIAPLNPGPGEGTLPSVWPADMVQDWQQIRWTYSVVANRWERSYLEISYASEEAAQRALSRAARNGQVVLDEQSGQWRIELAKRQP